MRPGHFGDVSLRRSPAVARHSGARASAPLTRSLRCARTPRSLIPVDDQKHLVALAKVGRPYGLTGAVHLYPYSADAQTLLRRSRCILVVPVRGDARAGTAIASSPSWLVSIRRKRPPNSPAREVLTDRAAFAPLPDGEYYWWICSGLTSTTSERVWRNHRDFGAGAHPILRAWLAPPEPRAGEDELIPFVDAIVRSVDLGSRRVDVDWAGLD